MTGPERSGLPPEIETLVGSVLDAAELRRGTARNEVEGELRAHFEDGLERGVSADEIIARFGDAEVAGRRIARARSRSDGRNRSQTGRWWMSVAEWWHEIRGAARRLGRAPAFAGVVVLTLALGVGVNTAIFTVLDAVLLEALPYPEPERLVRVYESSENDPDLEFIRAPVLAEWMTWDEVFEGVGSLYTYRETGADLTGGDAPRRVTVMRVSAGYFETLGVAPELGRAFLHEESLGVGEANPRSDSGVNPSAPVAVLAHGLWNEEYGADPDVVGRAIELDGASFEIVGVMPRGFNNPFGAEADVWVPQDLRPGGFNHFGNYYLSAVARLRPGLNVETAQERLRTLARGFAELRPEVLGDYPALVPLQADVVGGTRRAMLLILAGAAGLVLLTACVNVANLLFARGLERDRDLALRSALGSGRSRLVASILAENGLLAAAGGLLGVVLGWAGVQGLLVLAPQTLPRMAEVRMDATVFVFALAVTAVALVVFGLTPALRLSRTAPADVLRSGDRASTVGRIARKLRDALVVLQVAAALVLVAGATLLARSFGALLDVPLGVESGGVLTFEVHLPTARYPDPADRDAFHVQLHQRVAELPGVEAVGATSWLPVTGRYHIWGFYWEEENPGGANRDLWRSADVRTIAGDYFDALGIDLLEGVAPGEADLESEPVVWVSQATAAIFGDAEAVGQPVFAAGELRRVMGVVEDIPYSTHGDVARKVYVPHLQADDRNWALIQTVKARGDLTRLLEAIRSELAAIDGQLVLYRPRPFEQILGSVRAQDRFATLLMGAFAILALILSQVGTYGVLAGSVARRTREFGIRMALGADSGRVRAMVLRYAAALTVPGVLLGLGGAWVGGRWIEALLFEVEPADPVAHVGAVLVFLTVGIFAAWLPAARATRVDTVEALTAE